jgi:UDP-glucose 4-epimerase
MKKIFITGINGYIGQHLYHLLKDEYEVFGLDITPVDDVNLFQSDIRHWIPDYIFSLADMPNEFDAVIHLAALIRVSESVVKPIEYYETNIMGTINALSCIKTKNFILASTGAAENPINPYSISKLAAESIVKQYCASKDIDYTIFRFYNVIGSNGFLPTNVDGLMYNLIKAKETGIFNLFGHQYDTEDGTAIRDYIHVMEICHAIKLAIETPANTEVENLGTGLGHSVFDIVNRFMIVNNCDIQVNFKPARAGDLPATVLKNVSPYMKKYYTIDEMLRLENT